MATESSAFIPRAFLSSPSTTAQGAPALPQLLCWPFFKYLSLHRWPPFCLDSVAGEVQVKMHKSWWSPWWWWFTRECLEWKEGRSTMSFIQLFLPKDFWKLSSGRLKKERKCHHVVLVWSFVPSISTWEQGGTGGRRSYLLANVKKWWEITQVELIEPTFGKWFWHVGSCRTWPFNLPKLQTKLNCPRETSGDCLRVGPWRVLWPVKKIIVFFGIMACVWKLHPAVVVFIFYSVSSAFRYWQLLEVRWHIMKMCIDLWGFYFPLLSPSEKISHCAEMWYLVWSIAEQWMWKLLLLKTGPHHTTAVRATPRAVPNPETLQIWSTWHINSHLGLCSLLDAFLGNPRDTASFIGVEEIMAVIG